MLRLSPVKGFRAVASASRRIDTDINNFESRGKALYDDWRSDIAASGTMRLIYNELAQVSDGLLDLLHAETRARSDGQRNTAEALSDLL